MTHEWWRGTPHCLVKLPGCDKAPVHALCASLAPPCRHPVAMQDVEDQEPFKSTTVRGAGGGGGHSSSNTTRRSN
jgi:hypothetical protein